MGLGGIGGSKGDRGVGGAADGLTEGQIGCSGDESCGTWWTGSTATAASNALAINGGNCGEDERGYEYIIGGERASRER